MAHKKGKGRAWTLALACVGVCVALVVSATGLARGSVAWADEGSGEDASLVKEYLAGHISADYVDSGLWGSLVAAVSGENGLAADGLTDTGFTVDVTQLWTNSFLMDDDMDVAAYIEEEGAVLTVYAHTVPVYDFGSDEWVAALVDMTRINGASKLCAAVLCDTEGVVPDVENGILYLPKDAVGEDKERPFCRVVLPYSGLEEAEVEVTVDGETVDTLSFDVLQGSMSMELSADDEGEDVSLDNVTLSVDGNEVDDEEGSLVFYDEDEEVLTLMASPTTMASLDVSAASYAPVSLASVSVTNGTITFENGGTATVSNGVIRGTCTVRGNGFDYNVRLSYFGRVTMPDGQVLQLKCAEEYLGNANHMAYVAPVDGTYSFRTIAYGDSYIVIIESRGAAPVLSGWPTQRLMTTTVWSPKEATGAISVIKTVSEAETYNTKVNRQATFGFWTNSSCSGSPEFSLTTDPNTGTASRSGLKVGTTYYVKETSQPTGTTKTATIKNARIAANSTVSVSFNNSLIRGGISGTKADSATGATPSGDSTFVGSTFVIKYTGSGKVRPFSTTSSGANGTVKDLTGGRLVSSGTDVMSVTVTDATGAWSTGAKALPTGSYEVRETVTDKGHTVNTGWKKTVTIDADGGVKGTGTCSNGNTSINLKLVKLAKTSNVALSGAKFDLVNVSANPVVYNGKTVNGTSVAACDTGTYAASSVVATLTSGDDGTASLSGLPYGTYRLVETESPKWYALLTSTIEVSPKKCIDGSGLATGDFFSQSYADGTLTVTVTDTRGRADLLVKKAGSDSSPMAGVAFLLINDTTGESHVAVTGSDGYLRTARAAVSANANDGVLAGVALSGGKIPYSAVTGRVWEIDASKTLNKGATVWFNFEDADTPVASSGALQLGEYRAYELSYKGSSTDDSTDGEPNFGHRLHDFTFTLDTEGQVLTKVITEDGTESETVVDDEVLVKTSAHDVRDDDLGHADAQIVYEFNEFGDRQVVDELDATGVRDGDSWTVKTYLIDKAKHASMGTKKHTCTVDCVAGYADGARAVQEQAVTVSDNVVHINTSGLSAGEYVIYEYVYNEDGRLVSKHAEIDSAEQSVTIAKATVSTTAWQDSADKKTVAAIASATMTDTCTVTNTNPCEWYCAGVLVDKDKWADEVAAGAEPEDLKAEAFAYIDAVTLGAGAERPSWVLAYAKGDVQGADATECVVTYEDVDLTSAVDHEVVFFEAMYRTSAHDGVPDQAIAAHTDIDDEGQRIYSLTPATDMPMTGSEATVVAAGSVVMAAAAAGCVLAFNRQRAC